MISQIFWIVFGVEAVAAVWLGLGALSGRGWGPEGPVGAWLLFVPGVFLIVLGATALVTRSQAVMAFGIAIMASPLIAIVVGPIYGRFQKYQTERSLAGDDNFTGPQRKLAHAIRAQDVALVKNLTTSAGDLNKLYRGETLLRFAVYNTNDPAIVRTLLDAGANPNVAAEGGSLPLTNAIYNGPEMTEALLEAGADPNLLDSERPVWWTVLSNDSDQGLATLQALLDHGADIRKRDHERGPVAWAASHAAQSFTANWRLVWLLIERGAEWKHEKEFGQTISDMFNESLRRRVDKTPTEEMRKIAALLELDLTAQ
jgi:hypothetical protein